jgi:tetratricopeptide (TPR) repeat protein
MTVAWLVLAASLSSSPQQAPEPTPTPAPAPSPEASAAPEAAPAPDAGAAQTAIDAGLKAFIRGRFQTAKTDFQKAVDADPESAAANFYLGYATYKVAEKKRPFHPEKQEAAQLFAKAYELDPSFVPVWAKPKAKPKPSPEK